MNVTFWGTRGSLAAPGPETARYGGNTSCVEVRGPQGTVLVLDAGTGLRRLGAALPRGLRRVDLLLTHLHMDHLQGLGFFGPLYNPTMQVHIWGPASTTQSLGARLARYLSPPLFPIHLRDLPCQLELHEVPCGDFEIGEFRVSASLVCHPGPTVGYRIESAGARLAYMPDHEPALGAHRFPIGEEWTSGYTVARGVDLLIHDAQYSHEEYPAKVGWGHSSLRHALDFAALADVGQLVLFHHDPSHTDADLDRLVGEAVAAIQPDFAVAGAMEGATLELGQKTERSVGA
ncbi:MAG TPA: MBL fold metallo-hydrolase [Roseiflexaceae bacterium]|nr:MBL fold metallo-hydrolase [Roseiflexaceae bacterium]